MTENTIAVLPFVNISSNPENDYFSDGTTEEIINALARLDNLKVTSRTSSFFYKNKSIPLSEIAKQLDVAVILEGSIRIAGKMVRITAQLIQAADDFHFWSETWDRPLENIFEIQDEISLLIAEKLREQFGHFEIGDHLVNKQTDSLDAYTWALKARYHFNKWNPEDVRTAIRFFEKAVALDPKHTESYVGLADAYGFMATTEFMPREEAWQKAADYTHLAHALNPKNAGVHYQLANLAFFTACDFPAAFRHTLRSIELKPSYPEAQQFMAFLYIISEQPEKANNHLKKALSIDPHSQETQFFQAYFYYKNEDYTKALQLADACLADNAKNIPAYILRCYCLLKLGQPDTVIHYLNGIPADIIVPGDRLGILCLAYILKKDSKNAGAYMAQLESQATDPTAFQVHSYLYLAYVTQGQFDVAFHWLDKAIELKSSILLLGYTDPLGDAAKTDKRYPKYKERLFKLSELASDSKDKKAPLVDAETAKSYETQLLQFISEEQPFLNPSISLRSLAAQVQIHPNQLSWLLNNSLGQNFNEFINHHRIEHFKKLALEPANAHISIIGLAYESGFNSKTVFNTYFKKETGLTPKAFLKQHS